MMFLSFRPAGETKFSAAKSHQLLKYVAPVDCSHPLLIIIDLVMRFLLRRNDKVHPVCFPACLFHLIVSFRPAGETQVQRS